MADMKHVHTLFQDPKTRRAACACGWVDTDETIDGQTVCPWCDYGEPFGSGEERHDVILRLWDHVASHGRTPVEWCEAMGATPPAHWQSSN